MRLHAPIDDQENEAFALWAAKQLNITFAPPFLALAVVDDGGTIRGAVVLHNYNTFNVDLTGVGRGAFTPSIVRGLAKHVFGKMGCSRVTLRTRRSNFRARKVLERHRRFRLETALRGWFGNEDALQYRMCRDECPWLERDNGTTAAAASA